MQQLGESPDVNEVNVVRLLSRYTTPCFHTRGNWAINTWMIMGVTQLKRPKSFLDFQLLIKCCILCTVFILDSSSYINSSMGSQLSGPSGHCQGYRIL